MKTALNFSRLGFISFILTGCMMPDPAAERTLPALEYSKKVRNEYSRMDTDNSPPLAQLELQDRSKPVAMQEFRSPYPPDPRGVNMRPAGRSNDLNRGYPDGSKAQLRYVEQGGDVELFGAPQFDGGSDEARDMVTNMGDNQVAGNYQVYRSSEQRVAPYRGPLTLGDPGVTASLWQESRGRNSLFRDFRAFQPMDVITILVEENSEGRKEADTEVTEESDFLAGITNFLNFENDVEASNSGLDTANLITANTQNEFIGEGETSRRGSLKGKISAMVVEILPSGVMRLEGEKIISVNSEEQVMIISGLVRQRDINSRNEVMSGNVANLRVDYYGKGIVGEAQDGGWMSRIMRKIWPF